MIDVEGQASKIQMRNEIESRINRITEWTTSLDYRDGAVIPTPAYADILESEVSLSLHGFNVPVQLFLEELDDLRIRCKFDMPFVMNISIVVRSPGDLNLNAARDDVIPDNLWFALQVWVVKSIIINLKEKLPPRSFRELLNIWIPHLKSQNIRDIMNSAK